MAVVRPRSRTIGVRLSEDEFVTLRELCVATGARSVSDLLRNAMYDVLESVDRKKAPASKSAKHSVQIMRLELKVEELAGELASLKARQPAEESGN
ncbi:MAG: hypothetical protein ACRD19_08530 [Terriglobia bacterium]